MNTNIIPAKLYKKIVELVSLLCVDIILKHKGKYILVKRKNEPLKGQWWVIGGRVLKGEKVLDAAKRKIKDETGLWFTNLTQTGIYEDSYPRSAFGVPTSSLSIVFTADVKDFTPKIDKTSTAIKLSDTLPSRFLKHYK